MGTVIHPGFMHVIQPLRHSVANKTWSVTYALNIDDYTGDPDSAITIADGFFRGAWRPLMDTNITFDPAEGYYQPVAGAKQLFISGVAPTAGQTARNTPPPNVAAVVRKRTAFVGKAYRGRLYFPGLLDEVNMDENGVIVPAGITVLQTAANGWLTNLDTGPGNLGGMWLLHQKSLVLPTRVTSMLMQPIVRTQRRRLPRG
jgi:hypothetical protein